MADKHNEEAKIVKEYLIKYFRSYVKDKAAERVTNLMEKIAEKFGVKTFFNLAVGNFPTSKLATFTAGWMKAGYFEGYFSMYPKMNPYSPVEQEDEYTEYLLYSWARGNPGYMYNDLREYFKH